MNVFTPTTVGEALELRRSHEPSFFLGGGTLINGSRWSRPGDLVALGRLGLTGIDLTESSCAIGAMTTLSTVAGSPTVAQGGLAILARAAKDLQRINIRNAATLGGVVGANQAFSDVLPALIALDAVVEYQDAVGGAPQRESVVDYLARRAKERPLILRVVVPRPGPGTRFGMRRQARSAGDLPYGKVVCRLVLDGGRCIDAAVVVGATGITARRVPAAEAAVTGKDLAGADAGALAAAAAAVVAAVTPVADVRGGADFKKRVLAVLAEDALREALGEDGDGR